MGGYNLFRTFFGNGILNRISRLPYLFGKRTVRVTSRPFSSETVSSELLIQDAIDVVPMGKNIFRSKELWKPAVSRGAFGGQLASQALYAASMTIEPRFVLNSLHSYFLLPGNIEIPVEYHVQDIRTGRSFASKSVQATQKGKVVFTMICSFHVPDESHVEHQYLMPKVLGPENYNQDLIYEGTRNVFNPDSPNEFVSLPITKSVGVDGRLASEQNLVSSDHSNDFTRNVPVSDPHRLWWFRGKTTPSNNNKIESTASIDTQMKHQCALAYLSDFRLLFTSTLPHGVSHNGANKGKISMMASLDHSMWFHSPVNVNEWLLYEMESPRAVSGRGFISGRVFDRNGVMVASIAQEGLLRVTTEEEKVTKFVKNNKPELIK
ncbi:hypothetical protein BB559_002742 [Furculomyces boomerangus]|uniref:Acyl-CoA thioesterase II n=2 Tax=Harpellales TaxID=61421 RepID=A0A2T9YSU5_9FUNG|nr:hypothetical protein BB559_002742 [Furculomyces boomerangus]PVZ97353.1 hypothetical protein BB558_006688 [Smittium angustum]PVZ99170.1 hypothetical protein BB558_004809 [Smittium angustum]